jgi:hypothetical protein
MKDPKMLVVLIPLMITLALVLLERLNVVM